MEECVFCLRRRDLDSLLTERGDDIAIADLLALPQYFLPRPQAENDPTFKQLIPYQLFRHGSGFFVYERGSKVGEQRLAGRLSLGIGGHINSEDASDGVLTLESYHAALQREQLEELAGLGDCEPLFVGLINDDRDAVGSVHLGAVHLAILPQDAMPTIRLVEKNLQPRGFWTAVEIEEAAERFESWSLLALALTVRSKD